MQLYGTIADKDHFFKFDGTEKLVAYILDKYIDSRFEKSAEQTYIILLTRNMNEQFYDLLSLLVQKQSYFNAQANKSHKHLQKKLQLLLKITSGVRNEYFMEDQMNDASRFYPFDPVFSKIE